MTATDRGVAVVFDSGELLVVQRVRDGRRYAVLPGGGVESGEQPEEAALRELSEETGLEGQVIRPLWTIRHGDRTAHYFLVTVRRRPLVLGGPERRAQSETNRYQPAWVDPDRLNELDLQPAALVQRLSALVAADDQPPPNLPALYEDDSTEPALFGPRPHDPPVRDFRPRSSCASSTRSSAHWPPDSTPAG